jgi:hypothetical protein
MLQLRLEMPKPLCLTAAASMIEFLHSEPLTGKAVSLSLHTTLLYSHMHLQQGTDSAQQLEASRGAVECSASPPAAVRSITVEHSTAQYGRCTFTLASSLPVTLSEIILHARVSGAPHLSAAVPVKVWQLKKVSVAQSWQFDHPKATLKRVSGTTKCNSTSEMYASARVMHVSPSMMTSNHMCRSDAINTSML